MARGRNAVKSRGRPPKNAESAQRLAAMKKPKYLYSGQQGASPSTSSSTGYSPAVKSSAKKSSSRKESSSRRKPSPWEEDDDDDIDDELDAHHFQSSRSRYFEEYENDEDDDLMEDDECDEFEPEEMNGDDECGEDTNDTTTDGSNQQLRRPKAPPIEDDDEDQEKSVEQLILPASSTDLCVYSPDHLMRSLSIYEILRHFSQIVRLEVFRFEDFLMALHLRESSALFSQIHIQLLKALSREDDLNQTTQGPQDVKDSINGSLYFIDHLTWPQVLKTYLSGDEKGKKILERTFVALNDEYPLEAGVDHKLILLEYLCDCFLQTNSVRELITSSSLEKGTLRHDDHCRVCHKLGDLLCCEGCEAVYHLYCLDPPLESVPKDDNWICDVCKQMSLEGVTDCYTASAGTFCVGGRQEPLGWDRHRRKYWFMARRLFIEDTKSEETCRVYYYTLEEQFDKVYALLSEEHEADLLQTLTDLRDEIKRQMNLTKKLTQQSFQKCKIQQKMKIWYQDEEQKAKEEQEQHEHESNDAQQHNNSSSSGGDATTTTDQQQMPVITTGGILTRLKSGTIQQKQINLDPLKAVNHQQQQNEDDYILYEKEVEGGKKQLDKIQKKQIKLNSGMKFKLGFEGLIFTYKNKYTSNQLALNKHQHQEERDKKRFMSHKYSLTTASEFKWQTETKYESKEDLIQMIRSTLLHLESLIFAPFLHPNWGLHKQNWIKAVQMCCNAKDFLLALRILETSLKPCLFNAIWNESLGHLHLQRLTFAEREEKKKNEKKEKREFLEEQEATYLFSLQRCGGGVKYSLGKCKHQIWKQRGEEYRLTGKGGFYWFSALYVHDKRSMITKRPTVAHEMQQEPEEEVINISEQLTSEKRTFYKQFNYEQKLKIDQLLDKRLLMQQILNEEKLQQETKKVATNSCYSPICASCQYHQCYSAWCRLKTEQESTRSKVTLLKVVKVGQQLQMIKKSARRTLGKGQLPPCPRFTTNKTQKKSIFVLPRFELKKLARNAALREVAGFSYTAKLNPAYWTYNQTPRPLFRTCWLWRCLTLKSLSGVALQLRLLWSCLRWDDLCTKPPQSGQNVVTNENEVITTELLKRRDLAPFGIKSEYLVRRIIVPIDINGSEAGNSPTHQTFQTPYTPSSSVYSTKLERRQGLRERKRKNYEENGNKGPSVHELWVNEDELELWEIKLFGDKLEKQQQMIKDKLTKETIDTEKFKKNLEENLKKQREELKRKEAAQQQQQTSLIHSTPKGTGIKRIFTTKAPIIQQPQQGFAMIKTAAGQTYKVPLSAIPGKLPGQTIVIKTGGANVSSTTTATIVSTTTPPLTTTSITTPTSSTTTTTIRPLILQTPQQQQQKIQIIKPITTTAAFTPQQQQLRPTQSSAQIPIRLPDGRIQILQIPLSMLQSSPTIQIAIPAQQQGTPQQTKIVATPTSTTTTIIQQPAQQQIRIIGNISTPQQQQQQQPRIIQVQQPNQQTINIRHPIITSTTVGGVSQTVTMAQLNEILAKSKQQSASVTTNVTTPAATAATVAAASSTTAVATTSSSSSSGSGSFVITPQLTSEIVRQAIIQTQSAPEIQQKLLALQKQQQKRMQSTTSSVTTTTTIITTPQIGIKRAKTATTSIANLPIESTPPEKREEMMRNAICGQVIKSMLDKIEREEKNEMKLKKRKEQQKMNKWKQIQTKMQMNLMRNVELLKKEILRKRNELENQLRKEIEAELKQKEKKRQQQQPAVTTSPVKTKNVEKRKRASDEQQQQSSSSSSSTTAATTEVKKQKKLYCLCQTAYDCSRFMVGCDHCHNWFHCDCLGLNEEEVKKMDQFICNKCQEQEKEEEEQEQQQQQQQQHHHQQQQPQQQSVVLNNSNNNNNSSNSVVIEQEQQQIEEEIIEAEAEEQVEEEDEAETYCICKEKEYDESKFYICCDLCEKWYHGKCVGLLQKEADELPEYRCPKCEPNSHLNRTNLKTLNEKERKEMFQILQQVKLTTKYSWPFLKPVDRIEVPNYYQVIKEPIDLSKIETKSYSTLASFVADFSLMFENCFYFNDQKSQVFVCGVNLQQIFLNKVKHFRTLL